MKSTSVFQGLTPLPKDVGTSRLAFPPTLRGRVRVGSRTMATNARPSRVTRGERLIGRLGFTITEMLVATALTLFIMVILSEAFIAAVESFRSLKAIGDLETRLRTVATLLRR